MSGSADAKARLADLDVRWYLHPFSRAQRHLLHRATLVALPVFVNTMAGTRIGERERLTREARRLLRVGAWARWRAERVRMVVVAATAVLAALVALGVFATQVPIGGGFAAIRAAFPRVVVVGAVAWAAGAAAAVGGLALAYVIDLRITRHHRRHVAFHTAAIAFAATADNAMPHIYALVEIARRLRRMDNIRELPTGQLQAVFADRFHQAADAVRGTTLWVALPKADTRVELQRFLAQLMRTLIDETYDDLPLAPPVTPVARRRAVLSYVRTVVIGLLPAGSLFAIHLAGVDLGGADATAKTVAIVWAVVTFLILIDPNLKERLDTVKGVKGLFSGSKPGD